MAKWSGRGQPPTRKKLHRWRSRLDIERAHERAAGRAEQGRWERSWHRDYRGGDALIKRWADE